MPCLPGIQLVNMITFEHLRFENKEKWLRLAERFLKVCKIFFDSLKRLAALGFNQVVNQWLTAFQFCYAEKHLPSMF